MGEKMSKLGNARWVVPIVAVVMFACVMGLVFYPLANMKMENLPFAVVSLDEGAVTPQGEMNAGDTMAEQLASSTSDESPIAWTRLESQEDLDAAIENNEFYGALVIPSGFTKAQVAAKLAEAQAQSETETPTVTIILDNAKSPLVTQQMKGSVGSLFEQMGVDVDVQVAHEGSGESSASPMSGMMGQQIVIMPLCMASMVGAIVIALLAFPLRTASNRWKTLGAQLATVLAASLTVALCVFALCSLGAGIEAPAGPSILFFWIASLGVMLVILGAADVATPLAALVCLCFFALGMATGVVPPEALPAFWRDWVFPWAPQHYIGLGVREILYMGSGAWNAGSGALAIYAVIGACLATLAAALPKGSKGDDPAGEGAGASAGKAGASETA